MSNVAPLHEMLITLRDSVPGSTQAVAVQERLASMIHDPASISEAPVSILPAGHPLRHEARVVSAAFSAATSGKPLSDHSSALQAIDRRSPFFGWRRAIGAIAAFHAGDDDAMERHLSGIEGKGPVGIVASALRALTGKTPFPADSPAKEAFIPLQKGVDKQGAQLRKDLIALLDQCDRRCDLNIKLWHDACRRFGAHSPALLLDFVHACLGMPEFADLCEARPRIVTELETAGLDPVVLHLALAQGLKRSDPEASTEIFVDLLFNQKFQSRIGARERAWLWLHLGEIMIHEDMDFCEIGEEDARGDPKLLTAAEVLRKSIAIHPTSTARLMLLSYLMDLEIDTSPDLDWSSRKPTRKVSEAESEAQAWRTAEPKALEPVLFLLNRFKQRDALPDAWTLIDSALALAPIEPSVKQIHLEALVATIERQIQNRAPWAAKKRLAELSALLPEKDGRRPYLECLRWALAVSETPNLKNARFGARVAPIPESGEDGILANNVLSPNAQALCDVDPGLAAGRVLPSLNEPLTQTIVENDLIKRLRLRRLPELLPLLTSTEASIAFLRALATVGIGYLSLGKILQVSRKILDESACGVKGQLWTNGQISALTNLATNVEARQLLYRLGGYGLAVGKDPSPYGLYARGMALIEKNRSRSIRLFQVAEHLARRGGDTVFAEHMGNYLEKLNHKQSSGMGFLEALFGEAMPSPKIAHEPITPESISALVATELDPRFDPFDPAHIDDKPKPRGRPQKALSKPIKPKATKATKATKTTKTTKTKAKIKTAEVSESKAAGTGKSSKPSEATTRRGKKELKP
ncbi:MAG: hypothetical protein WA705_20595 [Candidatus Ozemobacteraceae bacterium]